MVAVPWSVRQLDLRTRLKDRKTEQSQIYLLIIPAS